MITGEIKNKIDQIWDTFFVAGITNPITVLEQMTYIFFMKMLDDNVRAYRGELGHVMGRQLRIVPELVFYLDTSLDYAEHIEELLKK